MSAAWPQEGVVYTETVVHTPPERYAADAPYQLAILQTASGERFTARIESTDENGRVRIGDRASFIEERDGVGFYKRLAE